jgi:hypothetical protein
MAAGTRHAEHVAPSIRKRLAITSPTSCGRSVGIVRSRTQATEFYLGDIGWGSTNCIQLAQDGDQYRALVNVLRNVLMYSLGKFLSS